VKHPTVSRELFVSPLFSPAVVRKTPSLTPPASQAIFVVETTQNRSRRHTGFRRKPVTADQERWQTSGRIGKSQSETRMRTAAIGMTRPLFENASQVGCKAQAPENPL
jgi:hypothetical protein